MQKIIRLFTILLIAAASACGEKKDPVDVQKVMQEGVQREKAMMEGMQKNVTGMETKTPEQKEETKK